MEYRIKFLEGQEKGAHRGHLYVGQDRLSLVADFGTPWLTGESGKMRIARPSGEVIALLEFPGVTGTSKGGRSYISYALIYDDAVYAIITKYPWPEPKEAGTLPYFVIEAEGQKWLALGELGNGRFPHASFVLCDDMSDNLKIYARPFDECATDPAGQINQSADDRTEFQVMLPDGRFHQSQIILLALVFLIYQLKTVNS
jgi:hypothetical protein